MITIAIKTDNEAFQDGNRHVEIGRILGEIARAFQDDQPYRFRKLFDINGNAVGTVTLTGKDKA